MKRIAIGIAIFGLVVFGALAMILFQKRSDPTIVCLPTDHGTRSKTYCVLNPFRNRDAEGIAERVLKELKNGNTEVLAPYLVDRDNDDRERYLGNEGKYRIISWQNGEIDMTGDELSIQYWVARANYEWGEEEVRFFFRRTADGWDPFAYTAIY